MRINKKGRVNGTHSQHRVSLMVDEENWQWYCNLKNKARAINDLMAKEQKIEDELYYQQLKVDEEYLPESEIAHCSMCPFHSDTTIPDELWCTIKLITVKPNTIVCDKYEEDSQ